MKKSRILLVGLLSLSVFMSSCGEKSNSETSSETGAITEGENTEMAEKEMTLNVNTENSVVKWEGTMLGLYSHTGVVKFNDGKIEMKGDHVTGGSFVVDMKSMSTTDENYDEEKKPEMLIGHLSSDDFFAVEANPTASFEITGSEGNVVMGNLTIRGVTHEEKVTDVTIIHGQDGSTKLNGNLTFDRQKYNVAFSMNAKDKVLSDEIELSIIIAS